MSNLPVTAEDLYLYAMGLLEPEEHTRIAAFLLQSQEARTELVRVRSDIGFLALTAEDSSPTPAARQRLLAQVAREQKAVPEARPVQAVASALAAAQEAAASVADTVVLSRQPESGYRVAAATGPGEGQAAAKPPALPFVPPPARQAGRTGWMLGTLMPWLGWAVAAGLVVAVRDFHQQKEELAQQLAASLVVREQVQASSAKAAGDARKAQAVLETMRSGSAQRFVLTHKNARPVPSARVAYVAESGSLVFQGNSLAPLPAEKTYELWLIPNAKGAQPIPAGTFKPDAQGFATMVMPDLPRGLVAETFGVTVEDDGGAQHPTSPILMAGYQKKRR